MSKNTRKRASTALSKPTNMKISIKTIKTPVEPLLENIFASSWKNSDIILACGDPDVTEFHVHRTILTMHSPVFEAMLGGNFKEAKESRIVLPGKNPEEMLQFLKLLYPDSMIRTPCLKLALGGKNVYGVLRLADEYQTEELMRKCLAKITVARTNVFEILPFANKYNFAVREKCVDYVAGHVRMEEILEIALSRIEAPLMQELLVAKCQHLESCLEKYEKRKLNQIEVADQTNSSESSSSSEE